MKYKLTVIKYEDNENYEAELARFKEERGQFGNLRYGNNQMELVNEPRLEKQTRSLEVILTEDEFKKVKAEVIKVLE